MAKQKQLFLIPPPKKKEPVLIPKELKKLLNPPAKKKEQLLIPKELRKQFLISPPKKQTKQKKEPIPKQSIKEIFEGAFQSQAIPGRVGGFSGSTSMIDKVIKDTEKILRLKYKKYKNDLEITKSAGIQGSTFEFSLVSGERQEVQPIGSIVFFRNQSMFDFKKGRVQKRPEFNTIVRNLKKVLKGCPTDILRSSPTREVFI